VNELFVKIGADFKELEKGLSNAQSKIADFGKATSKVGTSLTKNVTAPILAVGGGLLALGIKLGNTADRILDLNAITGMTTNAIQEWQFVTKEAGVSTEAVTNATQKLTKQMFALENDSGKASESFAKLGLNFEEFNNLSADARIETLIDRLSTIEDETERARIGTELLGGAWQDIAPIVALGSDAIANARQEARDMGAVMDGDALEAANNFRIQMEKLKTQFQVAGNEIGLKFLPILTDTLIPILQDNIIPLIDKVVQVIKVWVDRFMELDDKTKNIILAVIGVLVVLGPILIIVGKMITIFATVIGVFKTVVVVIGTIITVVKALGTALLFLLANPVGLIILGIVALVTAGILLYKNWEKVKEFAINIWEFLQGFLQTKLGVIAGLLTGPIGIGLLIIANWELIKEKAILIFNAISNTLKNIFTGVRDFILNIFLSISSGIMNQITKIKNAIDGVLSFFKKTKETIDKFAGGAKGVISSAGSLIKSSVPFLSEGGIITRPTLAMIGEGGESEAVIPLSKLDGLGGGREVHIYLDGREITRSVAPQMVDMLRTKLSY